ncbi:MAG: FG-GAP repeat domain-containing protein, partial [Candidatus Zixiibacteriota bacterium]
MKSHLIRTVAGFCLLTLATTAPAQYRKDQAAWPVTVGGDTLELPFLGGLNDPKPVLLDYDDDALTDLFIGQRDGRLIYLKNVGSLSQPSWQAISERLGELDIGTWFTFADIDADGDFDLFCDSRAGSITFYRNDIGPGATGFTLVDTAFGGFNTGINNTPTFADIDGDGDLDYFFGILTGWLEYWENVGDSTNYSFTFVTDRYDSILAFPGGGGQRNPQHGFSAVRFADIDSDNDLDLFWGDINNLKMYHFENLGNSSVSDLTLATEHFLPVATIGFNHPAIADMDADTDLDMLVGVANGADIDNLRMFRNDGTPTAPSYVQASTNYIDNIDFGSNSMPTLGDLDGDGDLDLLVGGILGTLAHFENVGSASQPSFKLISTQFQSIDVGFSAAPVLVDWDNDTDLDLLIGTQSGKIEYWRND